MLTGIIGSLTMSADRRFFTWQMKVVDNLVSLQEAR